MGHPIWFPNYHHILISTLFPFSDNRYMKYEAINLLLNSLSDFRRQTSLSFDDILQTEAERTCLLRWISSAVEKNSFVWQNPFLCWTIQTERSAQCRLEMQLNYLSVVKPESRILITAKLEEHRLFNCIFSAPCPRLPVGLSFVGPVDNTSDNFVFCLASLSLQDLTWPLINKQGSL